MYDTKDYIDLYKKHYGNKIILNPIYMLGFDERNSSKWKDNLTYMVQDSHLFFCRDQNEDAGDFNSQKRVIKFIKSLDMPIVCNATLFDKHKDLLEKWGVDVVRQRWPLTFLSIGELIEIGSKTF